MASRTSSGVGVVGLDDGALDDHVLIRRLLELDHQRHRPGPLDELGLTRRRPVLTRMFPPGRSRTRSGRWTVDDHPRRQRTTPPTCLAARNS